MPITNGQGLRQLAEREERVFPSYPQVARYFPASSIEEARHGVSRAIERGDGPCVVIGGPGTGKSLLLQVLASQYHERYDVVLPACARLCTRRALLQAMLFELGLPYKLRDEGDLRLSLLDHLLSREECPSGLLLLVDEAQTLSVGLLDELRVLTNLVRGGMPRVRLVLAGSSVLEECFTHPELESFSQRLATRCYLGPFGRDETTQFVRAQVAASSVSPEEVFANDAWDAIFEATDGVPRLVNQLCDRALIEACAANKTKIDRRVIEAAWSEIQQLPAPWDTPAPTTSPSAPLQVVEFGSLTEEPVANRLPDEVLIVDREEDDFADADRTELDVEEEEVVAKFPISSIERASSSVAFDTGNPFDEEFDEEEIVLDSFAGWDEMFRREAPRVQNRRDPDFSSLVQSAIASATVLEATTSVATAAPYRMRNIDVDNEIEMDDLPPPALPGKPSTDADKHGASNWPPLRLAFGLDSPAVDPKSAFEETMRSSAAWAEPAKELPAATRSGEGSSPSRSSLEQVKPANEDPVLIVEDDPVVPPAPVRREEYRNLFSRLRSG